MKRESKPTKGSTWRKTQYANLWRHKPSGTFYARARVAGKLRVRSLGTDSLAVPRLRLGVFIKSKSQSSEGQRSLKPGKMFFDQARTPHENRLDGNSTRFFAKVPVRPKKLLLPGREPFAGIPSSAPQLSPVSEAFR